jgi:AcrR family transcriptional regulator
MASARRVGTQVSRTRDLLLDSAGSLMLNGGHPAVTYRAVAARAGVTAGLVQYYFPALDDLFLAMIRRETGRNLARLADALRARPDEPLRVLWEFSRHEATAALMTEFTALGNRRESVRAEIAAAMEQVREAQLAALAARPPTPEIGGVPLPAEALLFLMVGIPKMLQLEEGVGVTTAHAEVVDTVERYLRAVEPGPGGNPSRPGA